MATGASIAIERLAKRYGHFTAVDDLTLDVKSGQFVTLLGASGSGKTTTLMMIAGFVTADSGDIRIDGRDISRLPPERRNLGVVFQSYALFPHLNVFENIAFPLRLRRRPAAEIERRVAGVLDLTHMTEFRHRRIAQLSGGQQQRVALARAIVFEPPALLMDEPLGALDRKLRDQLQTEIKRVQRDLGVTVIYVTHDQEEALALSDRIAIMREGRIEQLGTPDHVYERPVSPFVATFLGESNLVEGRILERRGEEARLAPQSGPALIGLVNGPSATERGIAMVRPEAITLGESAEGENRVEGVIELREFMGATVRLVVRSSLGPMTVRSSRIGFDTGLVAGRRVALAWRASDTIVFPAS